MGIAYSKGQETGKAVIDPAACNRCGSCIRICPTGCFSQQEQRIVVNPEAGIGCIACGQCVMVCPTGAVTLSGRDFENNILVELPAREQQANARQMEALLLGRRSIRHFTEEEVTREQLEQIVGAAGMGPMGFPPSEVGVVVLQGRQRVRELAWDGVEGYRGLVKLLDNPVARGLGRWLLKKAKYQWLFGGIVPLGRELLENKQRGMDVAFYDAPAALLFHSSPYGEGADPHIACTCAMLQAQAMGLGTTLIGCVPGPLATNKTILRKYGIPETHRLQLAMIIGHPAVTYQRSIRRQLGWVHYYQGSGD